MGLLDGELAGLVADALSDADLLKPATLIKRTPGTRNPSAPSAGTNPTEVSYAAKGIEQSIVSLQASGTLVAGANAAVRLFGATIAGGQVPAPNDRITIGGTSYVIVAEGVSVDAAKASYLCQCRK